MQERVHLVQGRLNVESRPGEGTTIVASVPPITSASSAGEDGNRAASMPGANKTMRGANAVFGKEWIDKIGGGGGSRTRVRKCCCQETTCLVTFLLPELPGNLRDTGSERTRNRSR
jgi:hypothetical protein